jgi:uncharacterized protein YndB with AHSA1/START domain
MIRRDTDGREGAVAPIVHSVDIAREPERVFGYITDPSHWTEWQDAVVRARKEGDEPFHQGSRVSMTRRMGRREQDMTAELTDWSPPRSYAFRVVDGPVRAFGNGVVEPVGEGSRFRFEIDFEGHGLGKLLVPLARRQARKELPETHANLKRRLESSPGDGTGPPASTAG